MKEHYIFPTILQKDMYILQIYIYIYIFIYTVHMCESVYHWLAVSFLVHHIWGWWFPLCNTLQVDSNQQPDHGSCMFIFFKQKWLSENHHPFTQLSFTMDHQLSSLSSFPQWYLMASLLGVWEDFAQSQSTWPAAKDPGGFVRVDLGTSAEGIF